MDQQTEEKLVTLLVQFVAQRFIHLPRKEIDHMLQLTPFEETTAGKEYIAEGLHKGMQQGMQQGIIAILEERFTVVPTTIVAQIQQINDLELLQKFLRRAATIDSIDAFVTILALDE